MYRTTSCHFGLVNPQTSVVDAVPVAIPHRSYGHLWGRPCGAFRSASSSSSPSSSSSSVLLLLLLLLLLFVVVVVVEDIYNDAVVRYPVGPESRFGHPLEPVLRLVHIAHLSASVNDAAVRHLDRVGFQKLILMRSQNLSCLPSSTKSFIAGIRAVNFATLCSAPANAAGKRWSN